MVAVLSGQVWLECPLVEVGTREATPECVAELANVSVEAARQALARPREPVFAGWVTWRPKEGPVLVTQPDPEWEQVGESRYGHPVYAPRGVDINERPEAIIEPFYVMVSPEE